MSVTLTANDSLYAYNGELLDLYTGLLDATLLPAIETPVSGVFTDDDGTLDASGTSTVAIDGNPDQAMTYLGSGTAGLLGGGLGGVIGGILVGTTPIMAFSVETGTGTQIYLYAPEGFPALTAISMSLDIDASETFDLAPSTPGVVDGKSGDDVMNVGYEDDDGDEITDYDPGWLGIGYQSGDDVVYGYSGNDTINAGSGDDEIHGGTGDDILNGGDGDDTIHGDEGNDTISGGAGADTIYGGEGNDTIEGGEGDDTVYGGDGDDTWLAGTTSSGNDKVYLEGGDDTAEVGFLDTSSSVTEVLDGGDGEDTVAFDAAVVDGYDVGITLNDTGAATNIGFITEVHNFENVRGNSGENTITGNNVDNKLWGLGGDDTLSGGGGNDLIDGGDDDDTLTGGSGDDEFVWSGTDRGNDIITDFGTDSGGPYDDDDTTNNDFVDLSAIFNDSTLADYNAANGTDFAHAITALNHDLADGVVNFDGTDMSGPTLTMTGITGGLTEDQTAVVCFASGTLIKTCEGEIAVEDLKVGDKVLTLDDGYQPIRWIGMRKLSAQDLTENPKLRPIRIRAGALGNDMPTQDLTVSPQHRVLANSKIAERMFGVNEVLVGAKHLIELDGVEVAEDMAEVTYVHFLFEEHQIVFSNGARTESLYTGAEALKSISPKAREEIYAIFPGLQADPDAGTDAVRLLVPGRQARKLAERSARNDKRIFS
ncbi:MULTISPECIES: Hint domain-containing protein [Pacificibacter]|uniref:Hint domain-containing protein n=1 Tax=Pacificibacter TaxID=1042323 RepID=UPI0025B128F3|nr:MULTISPECIES: Hint domain-containing protein [Pacificibacter]MDO6614174.1 Hint domain-containing protein [Pacificibacter sp. 1_MG-2023]